MIDRAMRRYAYVGPNEIRQQVGSAPGTEIRAAADLARVANGEPMTFVVDEHGILRVADRLCLGCGERNLVKDDWFECAMCGAELPALWNFGSAT